MKTARASLLLSALALALAASCASSESELRRARAEGSQTATAAAQAAAVAAVARDIRAAPSARDCMLDLIKAKKLVFLGELHVAVDPVLFLAENLRSFYDAGLRYLFYEGGIPGFSSTGRTDSRYSEPCFIYFLAPWASGGWKYEWTILSKAIRDLNAEAAEGERLRIIAAEGGHDAAGLAEKDLLDSRDAYAFDTIVAAMEASREGAKGLVFYGQSHGEKKDASWTTMGSLLAARYGESFASVAYDYLEDCYQGRDLDSARKDRDPGIPVAIDRSRSKDFGRLGSHVDRFDAFILDLGSRTYGVCYQYVQSKDNLVAMFTTLYERLEGSPRRDELLAAPVFRSEYFLLVYYLRLYYGELFDYDLWNPEGKLLDALTSMEPIFLGPGADPVSALAVRAPGSVPVLEEYHRLIFEPTTGRPDVDAAKSYEKAAAIFPEDLWASEGLATALMDRGDYDGALALFDAMLAKRLSRCMETLPGMYERAAACAEALGMKDAAAEYRRTGAALVNEHALAPLR